MDNEEARGLVPNRLFSAPIDESHTQREAPTDVARLQPLQPKARIDADPGADEAEVLGGAQTERQNRCHGGLRGDALRVGDEPLGTEAQDPTEGVIWIERRAVSEGALEVHEQQV